MNIMTGDEIIHGIIAGKDMRREIWERNAAIALNTARRMANNKHDANGCRKKNCVHGNEELVQLTIAHAAKLTEELAEM